MLFVEDNVIYITKGDDGTMPVNVSLNGEPYTMGPADVLIITVREMPDKDFPELLRTQSLPGSNNLVFVPSDSEDIDPGKYSADIELIDGSGKKHTIWPKLEGKLRFSGKNYENFVVMPEVT
jgi:hypothetical protein